MSLELGIPLEAPKFIRASLDIDDLMFHTAPALMALYRRVHQGTTVDVSHWNTLTAETIAPWGVETVKDAVARVNAILDTPEFNQEVEAVKGMDGVIGFLARRAELSLALTGRPGTLKERTLELLEREYPGHYADESLFFSDYTHDTTQPMTQGGKLGIIQTFGITHHGDDHLNHAIPIAEAGILVPLFGHYPWNTREVADMPPTMVRTGDGDALLEYFEDEDRRLINGDPWDPATARRFY
ncbi:MAG: hypothetical protein JWM52_123 [Candidatus Saccharibacteria bacterium]|nr:hypothetical protein [Candidatus Saccharibacteria bacterium]